MTSISILCGKRSVLADSAAANSLVYFVDNNFVETTLKMQWKFHLNFNTFSIRLIWFNVKCPTLYESIMFEHEVREKRQKSIQKKKDKTMKMLLCPESGVRSSEEKEKHFCNAYGN